MIVDAAASTVLEYQEQRLREKAAPKTINEEVGFLLRILGERGEVIRAQLRKQKSLKLKGGRPVAKAFSAEEKQRLVNASRDAFSPTLYPALMLALNAGMRNSEIRQLRWDQVDLTRKFLTVGRSKTEAGEGRTIPLNPSLLDALRRHSEWYVLRFGKIEPGWYLFPFGRANRLDPTRPITTIKTAWANAKKRAGVTGRLHDSRHTLITELAESGAGDQTIMDIAGHVSRQMLKHYSHIRMEAKRDALNAVWTRQQKAEKKLQAKATKPEQECSQVSADAPQTEGGALQKSLHSSGAEPQRGRQRARKSLKGNGSPSATRRKFALFDEPETRARWFAFNDFRQNVQWRWEEAGELLSENSRRPGAAPLV
jgi:integrase